MIEDYQLIHHPDGGHIAAADGLPAVAVLPDGPNRLFKRHGQRFTLSKEKGTVEPAAGAQHIQWLVAELNGVRLYFDGLLLVLTTQDLYP